MKIAIVGGGPGGLFSAYLLERKSADACSITLFEASDRIGGKIFTKQFSQVPVRYEAGAAELYGYSRIGPDPLHRLVLSLGLSTMPLFGQTVVLGDRIMRTDRDIRRHFGRSTLKEIEKFHALGKSQVTPRAYYDSGWPEDNKNALAKRSFDAVLAEIRDDIALQYIKVAIHSDLAAEPHQTSGLFGIQNALIDDPKYVQLYSLRGGLQRLPQAVASQLHAHIRTNCAVVCVRKAGAGGYHVFYRNGHRTAVEAFDAVVLALPVCWLPTLEWRDRKLRQAIHRHHSYYFNPAHYLRITLLFRKPFWRHLVPDSFFQLDAFGGCCVYDEGAKQDAKPYGVLSWLLAGNDAMLNGNLDDETLVRRALKSLPASLVHGSELLMEGRVDRWIGAVTAHAAGRQIEGAKIRHTPEPKGHPRLFVVGDYLFDSTINGTLDSAEIVSNLILRSLLHPNGVFRSRAAKALPNGGLPNVVPQEGGIQRMKSAIAGFSQNGEGSRLPASTRFTGTENYIGEE